MPADRRAGVRDGHTTSPLRAWHHTRAAEVDQDAFGATWGNDAASVADIRVATPHHRARMVARRTTDGRLRDLRLGWTNWTTCNVWLSVATIDGAVWRVSLVVDALAWMRGLPLTAAYVNTGVDNAAALALYEDLGFERMDERLVIAARDLAE